MTEPEFPTFSVRYLARHSKQDIADVLERVAERMFVENKMDQSNLMSSEAIVTLMYSTGKCDYSDTAVKLFLMHSTDLWRARFYRITDKVNAYLLAAAEARHQHQSGSSDK